MSRIGSLARIGVTALAVSWVAVTPVSAQPVPTEAGRITVVILAPRAGALTGELDALSIAVRVQSTHSVESVSATVDGRLALLAYDPDDCVSGFGCGPGFRGQISLAGLPRGPASLIVTARDVFENSTSSSVMFTFDRPPTVIVQEPVDDTVARPAVHLRAECSDDDPAGCSSFRVTVSGTTLASGAGFIDETISLAAADATPVLRFEATDSAGQRTVIQRTVLVELSSRLREVAVGHGPLWDFDADRLLYAAGPAHTPSLVLRQRATGDEKVIFPSGERRPAYGYLTPYGAIFVAGGSSVLEAAVYEYRDGALLAFGLPNSLHSLIVKGHYAMWMGERGVDYTGTVVLFRRDLQTGTTVEVSGGTPGAVGNVENDVAPNGDVAYWCCNHDVYRYRDGISSILGGNPDLWETYPVTDGSNVVYRRHPPFLSERHEIVMHDGDSETVLAPSSNRSVSPHDDYEVNDGWIAFTRPDPTQQAQVWTRAPSGELRQVSFFGASSRIRGLSTEGEVAFIAPGGGLFLGRGDGVLTQIATHPASRSAWRDDRWWVMLGRSLFEVTTTPMCTYTLVRPSVAIPAGGGTVHLDVATQAGCEWSAASGATWMTISASGQGSASVTFVVAAHTAPTARMGSLTLGGQSLNVTQEGLDDADADGLLDSWESQVGLLPASAAGDEGASGDPDHDGPTNLQEYQEGTHPRGFFTRYFAEGATSSFFDTSIALLNVSQTSTAHVVLRFQRADGSNISHWVSISAHTRMTVRVKDVSGMATAEFSSVIESDQVIVADRTMTWEGTGYGSHAEGSIAAPATTWYLAEGATHSGFDLFYLIQNANDQSAHVHVRYLFPFGSPIEKNYVVAARSRFNLWVDVDDPRLANTDVSAVVTSNLPTIVERAMYKSRDVMLFDAGHEGAGITSPATEWFLAEGATGNFFDLFVLISNPGDTPAAITATFLLPDGTSIVKSGTVAPRSRFSLWVDTLDPRLADTAVSTIITATNGVPIIVERTMWWPGPTAATWAEAHNAAGLTTLGRRWALAEGQVGGSRAVETYILIANLGAADTARVTLYYEDGTSDAKDIPLPASSRTNVPVASEFPSAVGRRFGALVEALGADPQIAVERAMYSNAAGVEWAAGTSAAATKLQ
jgi:hypothetical protein